MELVVDANVIFAALIKNSTTRKLLLLRTPSLLTLYTTPFILEEVFKYLGYLAGKTGTEKSELLEMLMELFLSAEINIIPENQLRPYMKEALKVSPDKNDAQYFAIAMSRNCPIWSNDKRLKRQSKIKVINTADLLLILGGL